MKDKVLKIISQIMDVPVEQINEDSSTKTVAKWDSLKHMKLMLSLEEAFNVTFSDEEIVNMLSVKTIVEVLQERGLPRK